MKSVVHSPVAYQDELMLHLPFYLRNQDDNPPWDVGGSDGFEPVPLDRWFGNGNSICMEIGSGFGEWVVTQALADPSTNWLAVEKRGNRVLSILRRLNAAGLTNVRVVSSNVNGYLARFVPDRAISEVFVNYPDPWPKKKHTKRRLFKEEFLNLLAQKLQDGGSCHTVTDSKNLNEEIKWEFVQCQSDSGDTLFVPQLPTPYHATAVPCDYGTTVYQAVWRAEGRPEHYMKWCTKTIK